MNNKTKLVNIEVWFFKQSGKFYTSETVKVDPTREIFQLVDVLNETIMANRYVDYSMVIPFIELEHGFPCMIPIEDRK